MKTKSKLKNSSKRKISKRKISKVSKHKVSKPIKSKRKVSKTNPKTHKLTNEKILELAEIGKQTVNSEYIIRFLNDVIEDETPSVVAYGEISDAYDNEMLDHRTFVAIKKGLDIYFDRVRGGFAKRNPRRNRRN